MILRNINRAAQKLRILRILLLASAFAWGISVFGVVLPWEEAVLALRGLGASSVIPDDPMLDYWLRMAAGAFTGVGLFFLILAIWPKRFAPAIGPAAALMFLEGLVLLVHGLRLHLPLFPFAADTAFCIVAGAGLWLLRGATSRSAA